jgi:predicted esterase/catechol 2,3-dioxygenase-like lactoylglutathione lyase family enzyme
VISLLGGIHHVTAIAGDGPRNVAFYTNVLGLRLVKRTVNFDDPSSYHLYYGDRLGTPGSVLTFFIWPDGSPGRQGTGQVGAVSLAVPPASIGYWVGRLIEHGVRYEGPSSRLGRRLLAFRDPDGLPLEIAGDTSGVEGWQPWPDGPVPTEHAIRGIDSVTLWAEDAEPPAQYLTEALGAREVTAEEGYRRFAFAEGSGGRIDLRAVGGFWSGLVGVGSVHHVALRARDDEGELAQKERLEELGIAVTPVRDRFYFRSVYFTGPAGVQFEIATDGPGFTVDEPEEELGSALRLPEGLEPRRQAIVASLPPLGLDDDMEAQEMAAEQPDLGFNHRFMPGQGEDAPTLLLLHGTGGDENDLIPLGQMLLPGAALLSPRGQVLENGMPRFFRRIAEGVFDVEDLKARTVELAGFIDAAAESYGFDRDRVIAVGFSNGANIAGSLLLTRPDALAGAVLLRPMVPFDPDEIPDLSGVPVFIAAGRQDVLTTPEESDRLQRLLQDAGAKVTMNWSPGGHQLDQGDLQAARTWLDAQGF